MKVRARYLFVTFLVLLFVSPLLAQDEPVKGYYDIVNDWLVFEYTSPEVGARQVIYDSPNKVSPTVAGSVALEIGTGEYTYNFKVANGNQAKQLLSRIVIKFISSIYEQAAPNPDWDMGEYRTGRKDTWEWFNPEGIAPGQMQEGFSYKSKGLPSIIDAFFWGDKRKRFSGPYDADPQEIHDSFDRVFTKLKSQYPQTEKTISLKTVGPTAPPADFKPVDFLNNIINMKHETYKLGWIKNEGILKSLDAKLDNAKKDIEKGNTRSAKNTLKAFVNEVEAQGCESYENCPSGKHLTSEAYGLLKYNALYLIDHL